MIRSKLPKMALAAVFVVGIGAGTVHEAPVIACWQQGTCSIIVGCFHVFGPGSSWQEAHYPGKKENTGVGYTQTIGTCATIDYFDDSTECEWPPDRTEGFGDPVPYDGICYAT